MRTTWTTLRVIGIVNEDQTSFSYDDNRLGDQVLSCEIVTGGSLCTTREFDRAGRVTEILDPAGIESEFLYSDFGELMMRRRDIAHGPFEQWEYDDFGRPQRLIDADGQFRSFVYDSLTGDLMLDEATTGGKVTYQYDAIGRLTNASRISSLGDFGELEVLQYTGIDLDSSGNPLDSQWADEFCFGTWEADACAEPMLTFDHMRDGAGRIGNRLTSYGFPNRRRRRDHLLLSRPRIFGVLFHSSEKAAEFQRGSSSTSMRRYSPSRRSQI